MSSSPIGTELPSGTGDQVLCPPQSAKEQDRLGWLKEQVRLSRAFLETQRSYPDVGMSMDIIAGTDSSPLVEGRSRVRINRLKRQIREIVSTMTDFRLVGDFRTYNREFFNNLAPLRKLYLGWHHRKNIKQELRRCFQYAAVQGTGYASPRPGMTQAGLVGQIEIELDSYGALGVLPHQLANDHDIQNAYATTLYNEVPYHRALALYPEFKGRLKPSRTRPLYQRVLPTSVSKFLSPVLARFGIGSAQPDKDASPFPMVDVYQTYIADLTYNDTGHTIAMGEPGTSWYYEVPTLNSDIKTGQKDQFGNDLIYKAGLQDALLYPLRRLIIWTDDLIIYDGTSKLWHGQVPAIQFRFDDWPWDFLGYSLVRDNASIQDTINGLLRLIVDNANARINPPMGYSPGVDKALATKIDPRQPGQRIQVEDYMGQTFMKPLLDPQYYDIPAWIPLLIDSLKETMDHQIGVQDMIALAKSKLQQPGSDAMRTMLEQAGPLIKDIASNVESAIERLVYQVMCLMFQFYTTPRKIQLIGADQITPEEYDYDPGHLIPSHLPGEDTNKPSMVGLLQRAKHHMAQFFFWVEPGSLLNITGMTRQLMLMQAKKLGLWIDQWTIMESMGIPFGPEPEGTKNMIERFLAERRMTAGMAAEFEGAVQSATAGAETSAGGNGGGPGRPQTFQDSPKMSVRSDMSSTTRTSR